MAGKKKKTLANRLAKMSDEERARYLQHKADAEEEAKRRKEQLISEFMKKKIKKEDGFARLNLAKINQNWHQILRKLKCNEMKQNVEHMKQWINRVYEYKNRTISILLNEIEEAEEQYSYNFKEHSSKIDGIIENQHNYINKLQEQYDNDIKDLCESAKNESEFNQKFIKESEEYLKTILYTQTTKSQKLFKDQYEGYMLRLNEEKHWCNEELHLLKKSREQISSAIWRQIANVIRLYVQHTDARRMHFAELKMLDVQSASEISNYQDIITYEEKHIEKLDTLFNNRFSDKDEQIQVMAEECALLNHKYYKLRKKLIKDKADDKNKLKICTTESKEVILKLKEWSQKGHQLMILINTCKKLETEREQITKWIPIAKTEDLNPTMLRDEQVSEEDDNIVEHGSGSKVIKSRPQTSYAKITDGSSGRSLDEKVESGAIEMVKCHLRKSKLENLTPAIETPELKEDDFENSFQNLANLEKFWFAFNKVSVDVLELKEEKKQLKKENKELRDMMRAILEAHVLNQSTPNTRVSTRAPSYRNAHSAPLKRIIF